MKYKEVALGFVLAGTMLGSKALTLGMARGAVWIDQALELTIPVQIEATQAESGLCAEADVFYGESRQDNSRVQVLATATDKPDTFNLKISASAPIDEPVISLYLRVGCARISSRKYVLLPDFPSNAAPIRAPSIAAPQGTGLAQTATVPSTPMATPKAASSSTLQTPASPVPAPKASKPASEIPKVVSKPAVTVPKAPIAKMQSAASAHKPEKPSPAVAQTKTESTGKSRLRLDPIGTLSERVKTLESATTASSLQDDLARDTQRMLELQTNLLTLLDQAKKNEATMAALHERLEKAESDRVPLVVVYALLSLVVLAFGALAFLWSKRPRQMARTSQSESVWMTNASTATSALANGASSSPAHEMATDVDLMDANKNTFDLFAPHSPKSP